VITIGGSVSEGWTRNKIACDGDGGFYVSVAGRSDPAVRVACLPVVHEIARSIPNVDWYF